MLDGAALEIGLCWGTIHQADLVETIELAARFGFPTLQVTSNIYLDAIASGSSAKALRNQLADAGVRVRLIDGISTGLPGMRTEPVEFRGRRLQRTDAATCIAIAEALDAPLVNISFYQAASLPLQEMAEAVAGVCRRAAASGLTVVLEFVPGSGVADLGEALAIVEACGEPNCRILLDTWHLARSNGGAADIRKLPPGSIGAFQLSDRVAPPAGTAYVPMTGRLLPGEGELPLREIVDAAVANNPEVILEIEVFSEELGRLPAGKAAERVASALQLWRGGLHQPA